MNADAGVFGIHLPGNSVIHRAPVWLKLVLVLVASIVTLAARNPWVSGSALVVLVVLLELTRLPRRRCYQLALPLVVLLLALAAYQLIFGQLVLAFVVPANVLVCLYASRLLVLTSPGPDLLDTLVMLIRPARVIGIDPERVSLAISIMIRSIPYLIGAMGTVRDAARARGLERNPLAMVSPLVIHAIAHAHTTGDALVARGLGEKE